MKIQGAQGMSPEDIRGEIDRGGRLVIYMYCISILVMTFKRASDIRLIKAGHSPAAAGWPYVLVSVLCGWWGFPWGPIYTIETIYKNLCGGIDVTEDVLAQILPTVTKTPPTLAAAKPAASFKLAPPPESGFNPKIASLMAGAVALLIFLGISAYCFQQQQSLTVVVASGLDRPYSVILNGQTIKLEPRGNQVLQLAEGDFTLEDAPGGRVVGTPRKFNFSVPFFDHLGTQRVAIVNPDRTAVFLNSEIPYYKDGNTPPDNEEPVFTLLANQSTYFIPRPDFVIEPAASRTSMPSGTTRVVKTRLTHHRESELQPVIRAMFEKSGYDAVREHLMIQARHRADEDLLRTAVEFIKPEDLPAFFQLRLAERPVQVEWHRYYQQAMDYSQSTHDLIKEYRGYLQAEPGNGALMYLLGRQIDDSAEAGRLWQQALAASPPCLHAHGAMGYDALAEGRFAEAFAGYTAAEKAGLGGPARRKSRRELYWALEQPASILPEIAAERKEDPLDMELAAEEIRATVATNRDAAAADKLRSKYLADYQATKPTANHLAEADAYLKSVIAYQRGEVASFAELVSRFDSPFYKFQAAISRGNVKASAEVLAAQPRPRIADLLLVYLLAKRQGDEATAEQHYAKALEAMRTGPHGFRLAGTMLAAAEPSVPALLGLRIDPADKCILLAALGVRQPATQPQYFPLARKLNYNPVFPHQFLRPILAQSLK